MMYLRVFGKDGSWGNYAYASKNIISIAGFIGMDMWAPFGIYDFYAVIDMNNNFPVLGVPDSGDWVFTNTGIEWTNGLFPEQTLDQWQ
jgi:hypothetical protein